MITLVDRATCFCLLGALPGVHDAGSVCDRLERLIGRLPDAGYHTLTWDQGREMAAWAQLERRCGIDVYFADPHSPPYPANRSWEGCRALLELLGKCGDGPPPVWVSGDTHGTWLRGIVIKR